MNVPVNIHKDLVPYSEEASYRKIVRELELCVKLFHKNVNLRVSIFRNLIPFLTDH